MEQKNHQLEVTTQLFQGIMQKTKDIPFEIDLQERTVKIYRSGKDADIEGGDARTLVLEMKFQDEWSCMK